MRLPPLPSLLLLLLSLAPLRAEAETETFSGFAEPFRQIEIAAAEPGVIESLLVKEGDHVEAGQEIGQLDNGVLRATLRSAEIEAASDAPLRASQTRRDLLKLRLDKLQQLAAANSANKDELERAKADLLIAESDLDTARNRHAIAAIEVERIRQQIGRRTLRTPISGIVDRLLVDIAESAENSGDPSRSRTPHIATIVQTDRLRLILYLTPAAARKLATGATLPVTPAEGGEPVPATVEFISPVAEPASGTVRVKLVLPNPDAKFFSGTKFTTEIQ